MKTKTSILTALMAFAGGASLMAQVYSVNIVGYVNQTLVPGFNLIANQLVVGTNSLNQVLPTVPDGTLAYKMKANGTWQIDVYNADINAAPIGWYDSITLDPSSMTVNPGDGFFLNNPRSTNVTVTLVGEVKTGTNTVTLNPGFSLVSSIVPQSYQLLGSDFPVRDGMLYYKYKPATANWEIDVYNGDINAAPLGWYDSITLNPVVVQPAVGEGFFINTPGSTPVPWTRSFSVN